MSFRVQHVSFDFRAPYYTSGNPDSDKLWFVLHGYGQLASFFIQKFDFLENDTEVVAPQGLSHFYLQGTSGRVGASWMTSESRQLAIQNYLSYLNHTYEQVMEKRRSPPKHVTMLGFSQGVSTLIRWLVSSEVNFSQLIMCAGSFPEDVNIDKSRKVFFHKPCYYMYGNQDSFIEEGTIEKLEVNFQQYGMEVVFRKFEGKHEISRSLLEQLA